MVSTKVCKMKNCDCKCPKEFECGNWCDCKSSCWKDKKCNPFLDDFDHCMDGLDCINGYELSKCDGGTEEVEFCRKKCDCKKDSLSKICELCCTQILTVSNITIDPFSTTTLKPVIPLSECGNY